MMSDLTRPPAYPPIPRSIDDIFPIHPSALRGAKTEKRNGGERLSPRFAVHFSYRFSDSRGGECEMPACHGEAPFIPARVPLLRPTSSPPPENVAPRAIFAHPRRSAKRRRSTEFLSAP
jgi:hypothetical protein